MKRFLVLLLALMLALCSCTGARDLELSEDGEGYLDRRSGLVYLQMEPLYEATATGDVFAEFEDERGTVHEFFEIPQLSVEQFLADQYRHVYLAGDDFVTADEWELSAVSLCQENAISVVLKEYRVADHAETVSKIRDLWFDGEVAEFLPPARPDTIYSVKFSTAAYANLMYSFSFYHFEGGDGYLYSADLDRVVKVPADMLSLFLTEGAE